LCTHRINGAYHTQLYFPGEARDFRVGIFDKRVLMSLDSSASTKLGKFDLVLDLA
jgi:hypothetical protein